MKIVVNVSDAKASRDPGDTIITYSLGSCIGVTAYDPQARVAGMLHFQLPTSTLDANRAQQNPLMFADSGLEELLKMMSQLGANASRLKVKIAGAAQILDDKNVFNIGKRNHTAIRKLLWQKGILLDGEAVGGTIPRTLHMNVADGSVLIKTHGDTTSL